MTVGMVPVDRVVGKAVFRFMPLEAIGGLYDNLNDDIKDSAELSPAA